MAIPVTVGTFEAYHGGVGGGIPFGGGGAGNAERRTANVQDKSELAWFIRAKPRTIAAHTWADPCVRAR